MQSMRYFSRTIVAAAIAAVLLTGCGEGQKSVGGNTDHPIQAAATTPQTTPDPQTTTVPPPTTSQTAMVPQVLQDEDVMTVAVLGVDAEKREIYLDIGDWVHRNNTSGERNDMMYAQTVTYDETTVFAAEDGQVDPAQLKKGQKVTVSPPPADETERNQAYRATRIVKVVMSKQERWQGFLSHGDNFRTVVMYEEGTIPPYDEQDFEKHVPVAFQGGIWWKPYDEATTVDYKQEFGFDKLPVILVFDKDGVVFRTDSMDELKTWSDANRPNRPVETVD